MARLTRAGTLPGVVAAAGLVAVVAGATFAGAAFVACASTTTFVGPDERTWHVRADVCCAEPEGTAATAASTCAANGCVYQQALSCSGTAPLPWEQDEERRARASCHVACACVCPADQRACEEVP